MTRQSRLYVGHVIHRRLRPRAHRLRYRCFWLLLDLDELPALHRSLRLFAYNRLAPVSFHARDHGDGRSSDLREYIAATLAEAGIDTPLASIRLLSMPRIAGYAFNPLSIFFCYSPGGRLCAIVWEVNNTFGERHSYVIETTEPDDGVVKQACAKKFFVSPFMDQELSYEFRVNGPDEHVSVVIRTSDGEGPLLLASLAGEARELTDSSLFRVLVLQPFATLKVIAAIHWEALKLWLKGIGLRGKPPPPRNPVTVVRRPSGYPDSHGPIPTTECATPAEFQTT